jgi:hypothetical protein
LFIQDSDEHCFEYASVEIRFKEPHTPTDQQNANTQLLLTHFNDCYEREGIIVEI